MSAFDKAWAMVKDMTTATRSADLWVMNDEGLYFGVRKQIITPMVRAEYESDLTEKQVKAKILEEIAIKLPEMMAHHEGFMEELSGPVNIDDSIGDSISDVDWLEVARNFDEDIDGIMNDFYFDRHGEALTE